MRGADAPRFGQAETLVEEIVLTVGGSASIFACAAARLGLRTAMLGVVGDDALGAFMREALAARGVDVAHLRTHPDVPTGASAILARPDGDRAILTAAGTIAALGPEHVDPAVLAASRHVHVASAFLLDGLRPALPGLLRGARAAGATTSLDTNPDPRERYAGLDAALAETDVAAAERDGGDGLAGTGDATPRSPCSPRASRSWRSSSARPARAPVPVPRRRPPARSPASASSTRSAPATRSTPASSPRASPGARSRSACASASRAGRSRRVPPAASTASRSSPRRSPRRG